MRTLGAISHLRETTIIIIFVFVISVARCPGQTATRPAALDRAENTIRDIKASDNDVLDAIFVTRTFSERLLTPGIWTDIAGNSNYSANLRRCAIIQAFDRQIIPGMTLSRAGRILAASSWLRADEVQKGPNGFAGRNPILAFGQLYYLFVRIGKDQGNEVMILMALDSKPAPDDVVSALIGNSSPASRVDVTEVIVRDNNQLRMLTSQGLINESNIPNHWYHNSADLDKGMEQILSVTTNVDHAIRDFMTTGKEEEDSGRGMRLTCQNTTNILVLALEYDIGHQFDHLDDHFTETLDIEAQHIAEIQAQILDYKGDQHVTDAKITEVKKTIANQMRSGADQILAASHNLSETERDQYEMRLDQLLWREESVGVGSTK